MQTEEKISDFFHANMLFYLEYWVLTIDYWRVNIEHKVFSNDYMRVNVKDKKIAFRLDGLEKVVVVPLLLDGGCGQDQ